MGTKSLLNQQRVCKTAAKDGKPLLFTALPPFVSLYFPAAAPDEAEKRIRITYVVFFTTPKQNKIFSNMACMCRTFW